MNERQLPMSLEDLVKSGFGIQGGLEQIQVWGFEAPQLNKKELKKLTRIERQLEKEEQLKEKKLRKEQAREQAAASLESVEKQLAEVRKNLATVNLNNFFTSSEFAEFAERILSLERNLLSQQEYFQSLSA